MRIASFVAVAIFSASSVFAGGSSCPQHFLNGSAPEVTNAKLTQKLRELCNTSYAVAHSGVARAPIWSAELLTAENIESGRSLKRNNAFHADTRLPPAERAELEDFTRSGWDRGHMLPNKDFGTPETQYESFVLSNIVAQDPDNNQHLWADLEMLVRGMAKKRGSLYVITGPHFEGKQLQRLNGRVLIPTHIWKVIYDAQTREGGAWIAPNAPGYSYETISISELEQRIGINLFPALSSMDKSRLMRLPAIKHGRGGESQSSGKTFARALKAFAK